MKIKRVHAGTMFILDHAISINGYDVDHFEVQDRYYVYPMDTVMHYGIKNDSGVIMLYKNVSFPLSTLFIADERKIK